MSRRRSRNRDKKPKTLAQRRRKFWQNFQKYLGFCIFFVVLNVATGSGHFWAIYPIAGWGLGVFMEFISVYGAGVQEDDIADEEEYLELEDVEPGFELPDRIPEKKYRDEDMV